MHVVGSGGTRGSIQHPINVHSIRIVRRFNVRSGRIECAVNVHPTCPQCAFGVHSHSWDLQAIQGMQQGRVGALASLKEEELAMRWTQQPATAEEDDEHEEEIASMHSSPVDSSMRNSMKNM